MERNIAALMREDCRTVQVVFGLQEANEKEYTYLTQFQVNVGDLVVVKSGAYKIARVTAVHEGVQIEPNDPLKYVWLVGRVDLAAYEANEARNKEIEAIVAEAYKANLRRGFAATALAGVTDEKRLQIENLIKPVV
tara:strand:- start:482 stop:889 length:408 start_codon:yes stop_codon:yes gene_type:complete